MNTSRKASDDQTHSDQSPHQVHFSHPPHSVAPVSAKPQLRIAPRFGWKTLAFLVLSVAVCPPLTVLAQSWTAATPYPLAIFRYGFAQNGEDFYVISGDGAGGADVNTVTRYNAVTNVWTSLASIPVASEDPTAVYHSGRIYVGKGAGGGVGGDFQIYDIATNVWSAGPIRPGNNASFFGAAAGAFNGNVYFVGGGNPSGGSTTVSIYNIASNTWSVGPAAPSSFQSGGHAQIGQFLYLIGGKTSTSFVNSSVSMRFDMATNTWSTGPTFTPQRAEFALAAAGTKLFAMGGDLTGGTADDLSAQVFELETATWPSGMWFASPGDLPSPRRGHQAGFFSTGRTGGEIWSTGGFIGSTRLDEHLFRAVPPCPNYVITESTRPLVSGSTMDVGNHCDDCVTAITFPFPITLYGKSYTAGHVSSNGNLQFDGNTANFGVINLPALVFGPTIFPFWDNLRTDTAGAGIFTSVTGVAPNRVFTIEWRVSRVGSGATTNFQIRFREGSAEFEIVYGVTSGTFFGVIGVQRSNQGFFTQHAGPSATVPPAGTRLIFSTGCCTPIAFTGAIGSGSDTYPGTSGTQTGRIFLDGIKGVCGSAKEYPGTLGNTPRTYDAYSFTNSGPATCVTFSFNTACTAGANILPVAYLGSFDPSNIATNYLGDPGVIGQGFDSFSVNIPANSTVVLVVHEVTAGGACPSYDVVVSGLCPVELTSAVSRKTHTGAGDFDIPLPLYGQPGVECRSQGGGNHTLVFTLNAFLTSGTATVTSGIGNAGAPMFLGGTIIVPLSGVADVQKLTVTLSGVTNSLGQVLPTTAISMNALLGDTNANRSVNASDIGQTKASSGFPVNSATFRRDVNANGSINASDIGQVKANAGHTLP